MEVSAESRRRRRNGRLPLIVLSASALATATFLSCARRDSDSVQLTTSNAVITRAANTTLQMPAGAPTTYTLVDAFPTLTLSAPIAVTAPPGETNRLFVVERAGRI